jgi:hypothetical protein
MGYVGSELGELQVIIQVIFGYFYRGTNDEKGSMFEKHPNGFRKFQGRIKYVVHRVQKSNMPWCSI